MDTGEVAGLMRYWGEVPLNVRINGDVYQVTTNGGERCLKRMTKSLDQVLFMIKAVDYVWDRGFSLMAPCLPARDGKMVVGHEHAYFIVQEWLEGVAPDYRNGEDMALASETVARFHRSSIGFFPEQDFPEKNKLGKWPKKLRKKAGDLNIYLDMARGSPRPSRFEKNLAGHGDWLLHQARESIRRLNASPYEQLCEEARTRGSLVHGDTAAGNFILHQGQVYLIDFDAVAVDIQVVDLWRLLRRMLWRDRWDPELARKILDAYRRHLPLEGRHEEVLLALLYFPEKPWRVAREYYEKRHEAYWNEEALTDSLQAYLDQRKKVDLFLRDFERRMGL